MEYTSTRNHKLTCSASEVILTGIAPDGGLFVPKEFPQVHAEDFYGLTYSETAQKVLSLFLTDYDSNFLKSATEMTYSEQNFSGKAGYSAKVAQALYSLELWHGPTSAFKDYALQLMPQLLVEAKKNLGDTGVTKILVATSGDTGKAALAGYKDLDGIKIAVFYPNCGTSEVQRLQMVTQEGNNVEVYAVNGNFDDAQTGVKRVFADANLAQQLAAKGEKLSSANSINWGRLAPQIVYYFYTYAQLVAKKEIAGGSKISFCVPTGNFGDILAGYYAKRMGLPIDKLICASNKNNVLTEFLTTGTYNANRAFHKTTSPSMDILVSSNLERLLYHVMGDSEAVAHLMSALAQNGSYTVSEQILAQIKETFACGSAEDHEVAAEIKKQYETNHYLCDTHTAVAFLVAQNTPLSTPCVILSTANPYKFPAAVLEALGETVPENEFDAMDALCAKTGRIPPESLFCLRDKSPRFSAVIDPQQIPQTALAL